MKTSFNKFSIDTSRWSNKAITPLNFKSHADMSKEIVLLHPGWGKNPKILRRIMNALVVREKMPITLDTRFGYANSQATGTGLLGQKYLVTSENPYYKHATAWDNRYRLRRPTGVLALAEALGIESASLFGHSEGGRIMATVAVADKRIHIPRLVIANAVGTGNTQGASGQIKSNFDNNELFNGDNFNLFTEAIPSSMGSASYASLRLRRWSREKLVIENEDIWPTLDEVALIHGIGTTVLHAREDRVISFTDAESRASTRPHLTFIATEGGHSNVYTWEQAQLIANQFCQA